MNNSRFNALNTLQTRQDLKVDQPQTKVSAYFASNVFNKTAMQEYLHKTTFKSLMASIEKGEKIDPAVANDTAQGMKNWAMSKGVTHYTHWFQPLTGATAEKHDSFFTLADGKAIEVFAASALVQQEPDASSFPSGGIRNTFEARGYTAWDPTSPAFIFESNSAKTLCIPTIFVSYTGESLDYKAPLLKSLHAVEEAAIAVCNYFDRNVSRVSPTLGIEQEYFLVDLALYNARPDLIMAGRTLFGHSPAKGQQLEDHYFGSIPERVHSFMVDFEIESHKLGIPLLTRHNEVAPGQFECAPLFAEINLAVDQNQLLMDLMGKIARKHHFAVLLHEKPFAGINGSGKHNNWSLGTDTGINLLSPGKTPKSNLQFLTFFINVIKAFHDHADLIRAAIASAPNDHRLGANEAPPAIMSAFLGTQLTYVLDEIEKSNFKGGEKQVQEVMKHGIKNLPEILMDNTDRNRTSPFAFTGNKFELRAVGSSANCGLAMTVLNTAVAKQLKDFKIAVDSQIGEGKSRDAAILAILQEYIKASKNIRFEGNGYGDEWVEEAKKRGLENIKTTPKALAAFVSKKSIKLFEELNVYTKIELEARYEVALENYIKKIQIEAKLMQELVSTAIIPASIQYQNRLIQNLRGQKELGIDSKLYTPQLHLVEEISSKISTLKKNIDAMQKAFDKAHGEHSIPKMAEAYCDHVKGKFFDPIRNDVDDLELLVADELWPLPKYRELLFLK